MSRSRRESSNRSDEGADGTHSSVVLSELALDDSNGGGGGWGHRGVARLDVLSSAEGTEDGSFRSEDFYNPPSTSQTVTPAALMVGRGCSEARLRTTRLWRSHHGGRTNRSSSDGSILGRREHHVVDYFSEDGSTEFFDEKRRAAEQEEEEPFFDPLEVLNQGNMVGAVEA